MVRPPFCGVTIAAALPSPRPVGHAVEEGALNAQWQLARAHRLAPVLWSSPRSTTAVAASACQKRADVSTFKDTNRRERRFGAKPRTDHKPRVWVVRSARPSAGRRTHVRNCSTG